MVAIHLARMVPDISLALIEQKPKAGVGLAYGTEDPDHLLNVRAGQMGAFEGEADHFWRWLQHHPVHSHSNPPPSAQSFMPRMVYGQYLRSLLQKSHVTHCHLAVVQKRIVAMKAHEGGGFTLTSDDDCVITADKVVLALGNFPPDPLSRDHGSLNPYLPATWTTLSDDGDVLIVGTGLTSLDLVVTLAKTKTSGTLHLLSRHGLLPRMHTDTVPHTLKFEPSYPKTAVGLLRSIRKEIANAPTKTWQSVVDAFRPLNQILWQSLYTVEQRRFLRHLRAYWDVHRHRCAPEIMDAYHKFEGEGRIQLHRGSIIKQNPSNFGWDIIWRPRGQVMTETMRVRHLVRCTGPQSDFAKLDDAFVQNMLREGLIAPDVLHMGICTDQYAVCNAQGHKIEGLYALGSLLKGTFYESIAVPELRDQARDVAGLIAHKSS